MALMTGRVIKVGGDGETEFRFPLNPSESFDRDGDHPFVRVFMRVTGHPHLEQEVQPDIYIDRMANEIGVVFALPPEEATIIIGPYVTG